MGWEGPLWWVVILVRVIGVQLCSKEKSLSHAPKFSALYTKNVILGKTQQSI